MEQSDWNLPPQWFPAGQKPSQQLEPNMRPSLCPCTTPGFRKTFFKHLFITIAFIIDKYIIRRFIFVKYIFNFLFTFLFYVFFQLVVRKIYLSPINLTALITY